MPLEFPDFMKSKIKRTISAKARSAAIFASALALGFLVSIFELGCTGQVYFPFLAYMANTQKSLDGYTILLAYNIAFITPLIAVFVTAFFGVTSDAFAALTLFR